MNEQQLADLFSDQLDYLLQGQPPVLPPEASDLQELLDFGQQFSQITFQPSPAAQAAFQGQLTAWFGPTPGGLATILGVPKTLLFTFIATAILVGTGAGLAVLGGLSLDHSDGLSAPEAPVLPTAAPRDTPKLPTFNTDIQDSSESEATEPEGQATPAMTPPPQSSLGETIPAGSSSSMGDTLPPSSMGETLSLPTPIPTATAEVDITEGDVGSGESTVTNDTGDTDDGGDGDTSGSDDSSQEGDHDKGHGNDADNIDEDNPGNSGNVLGGDTNGQGQSGGLGGLGRGNDNNGGGQGGQGGGGQGGGKGKGKGGGRGKSGN